jgi:citronellyl-CoA dehydrogenase
MSISMSPFSDSHEMFRSSLRRFVEKEMLPHHEEWEAEGLFPRSIFERLGELGFLGGHYPEEFGGQGGDFWHAVVFAEELPRCLMAGVTMSLLVQTNMATPIIHQIGTQEQKEMFLKPAIQGKWIAALGVSEPGAGSDVAGIRTTARIDGDDLVINGSKTYITNGTRADFITLAVRTDPDSRYGGMSLVLFPTDTKGYSVGKKLRKVGNYSSDTAELFFDECRVPRRNVLGEEGHGFYYIMQNFQEERLIGAISALAGATYLLERTIEFCKDRKAFGKPIIKFQVNAHKIVDMATELEAAKRLCYHAADLYVRGEEPVKEISMCKLFVGELAKRVADQCLQLHGGAGYLEEYTVARAWRDTRLITIGGGTSEIMKEIISKLMGL